MVTSSFSTILRCSIGAFLIMVVWIAGCSAQGKKEGDDSIHFPDSEVAIHANTPAAVLRTLLFHQRSASNIIISEDRRVAYRKYTDGFGETAALIDRPLDPDEVFEVHIDSYEEHAENPGIGVTTHTPESIIYPQFMNDHKSGTWGWDVWRRQIKKDGNVIKENYPPKQFVKVGDTFGVSVTSEGSLHFHHNGEDLGEAASGLIGSDYYAYVDLYWSGSNATITNYSNNATPGRLIWSEEFDSLDETIWEHVVTANRGFNDEFQYYRNDRRNSYVRNGILYIQPTQTAAEFGEPFLNGGVLQYEGCNEMPCASAAGQDIVLPIQSARIRTRGSFGLRYGRVEVRARMPRGDWIWPAIWMLPVENVYGTWPASGEIDIIEVRSNRNLTSPDGVSQGIDRMGSTLHFGPNSPNNKWMLAHWEKSLEDIGGDFGDGFHIYELNWTDKKMEFFVDRTRIGGIDAPEGGFWKLGKFDETPGGKNIWENGGPMAPFDRKFFFILNVAVGGRFFPDDWKNSPYPKPWNGTSTHPMRDFWEKRNCWLPTWDPIESSMLVDYIRVYAP